MVLYRVVIVFITLAGFINAYADDINITTKYGNVVVSDDVERIVTLHEGALDSAVALGFEPVGAISTRGGDGVARYIQNIAKDIPIVSSNRGINIEAVVSQRPDVILASSYLSKEEYDLLSRIAPTIVPTTKGLQPDSWINELRFYAKALNREKMAEEIISKVDVRIVGIKKSVESLIPKSERGASLIRWMPKGAIVLTTNFFSTALLGRVGFDITDANLVKEGRPHSSPLSLENLSIIDNEWIFMATLDTDAKKSLAAAEKSPAFSRLNVVKKDHVISVDGQLWTSAIGPIAANAILDDIQNMIDTKLD